jgi:D-alanine-D-alanine ligase
LQSFAPNTVTKGFPLLSGLGQSFPQVHTIQQINDSTPMKNIAIIMGGYSSEFEISLKSGNVVYQYLDKTKYKGFRIHIFKEKWVYVDDNNNEFRIDKNDFSVTVDGAKIKFDAVFNAIHGTPGEDGLMQAYFDLIGLPQSSCDYYQAALTFNKRDLLSVLKPYGIKCAESYYLNKGDHIDTAAIVSKVGLPCFVKPNKSGSSFGISKVKTEAELPIAIEVAYKEDNEIIIESFLDGTEVSVGVINYQGKVTVLPITEIVSDNDFFDYEAKYLGKSQEITPARISPEMAEKVNAVAKRAYEILKMKGFSRSEFILVNGEPYMLEMNTIPGLTTESLIPQQAKAAGISLEDLFTNAIELAFK